MHLYKPGSDYYECEVPEKETEADRRKIINALHIGSFFFTDKRYRGQRIGKALLCYAMGAVSARYQKIYLLPADERSSDCTGKLLDYYRDLGFKNGDECCTYMYADIKDIIESYQRFTAESKYLSSKK